MEFASDFVCQRQIFRGQQYRPLTFLTIELGKSNTPGTSPSYLRDYIIKSDASYCWSLFRPKYISTSRIPSVPLTIVSAEIEFGRWIVRSHHRDLLESYAAPKDGQIRSGKS